GAGKIGTTGRGIGPAYADKTARCGLRAGDLLDLASFRVKLERALNQKNALISKVYGAEPYLLDKVLDEFTDYAARLKPYIQETGPIVSSAVRQNKNILLEGAHGTLLDPDHGTYPYVTSSSPTVAGLCLGAGLGPTALDVAVGVFKAYSTRVGGGPMPTELADQVGELMRARGQEFGTTTGRPRRCGWFDAVAAKHSVDVNGFNSIAVTKLDVLDELEEMKICIAYRLGDKEIDYVPADPEDYARCEPVFESHKGWMKPISTTRSFEELPPATLSYLSRLEQLMGVGIDFVGVGASRDEVICKRTLF
ncbi:MAG: adenylosuccinate synthetase, partial [Chloroflexota bacterium]